MCGQLVQRNTVYAGHGGHLGNRVGAFHKKDRPDQIVDAQRIFSNQTAREIINPVAPGASQRKTASHHGQDLLAAACGRSGVLKRTPTTAGGTDG